MENDILLKLLNKEDSYKQLVTLLEKKNNFKIELNGLFGSAKSYAFSLAINRGIHILIMNTKEEAQFICNDLYSILGDEKVYFFPTSSTSVSRVSTVRESTLRVQRSAAISALNNFIERDSLSGFIILVTYPEAINEKILNSVELKKSLLKISKGDTLSHEFIKETLFEYNFNKVDFVSEPGQFSLRGGIIDLFSYSSDKPFRVDFFGNQIDSIREFDINTQRSIKELDEIEIFPNIYDNSLVEENNTISLLQYTNQNKPTIWVDDYSFISTEDYIELTDQILQNKNIFFSHTGLELNNSYKIDFKVSPQPAFNKKFELLINNLSDKINEGYKVFISSDNQKQLDRLKSIFSENKADKNISFIQLNYTIHQGFIDEKAKVCLYTDHQIFDRYHRVKIRREVATSERLTLNELNAFKVGDYIVHIDHGIGIFGGLVKTTMNGKRQEVVKLIYKDNDVIFVSIHSLHRISRYKSKEASAPKIYKLGTGAWEKLKSQTKKKVKDIAKDLIKLYAERRQSEGFAFSHDTYLQYELEASFMYEDTPDQLKATKAIKEDMERSYPMDRLVCGDVGFGKTEIAIRAAFKAVADSKQVAVLVPTTILALQHYKTFLGRLKEFPCNIAYISRLKTNKEIKQIADDLKNGKIDIIIGTHRLLNKEIKFSDLGLLIIDEEQKFGVAAKERLKQIKLAVDTLTLTATPIPRTLQFSLLGARDLSIINTPPPNRLPIHTEIIDFDQDLVKEIINNELERGGQIYFIHNKVEDILSIENIINRLCPDAKTCVGHGQMDPKELEGKILDFIAGDYDILVATTIVENGIDVSNANTIIINQAQNFGLSDLHQLRGRVGRSNQKAFCYLIAPPMVSMTDDARRRLRAIEAFSDLGSGFNIAMQDLDIRGAGNLLGGEQSGFIADMGFETYQRILSEAFIEIKQEEGMLSHDEEKNLKKEVIKEIKRGGLTSQKGQVNKDEFKAATESSIKIEQYITDCFVDTDLEILIPDTYISQSAEKIRVYKKLDGLANEDELDKFIEELIDRFGQIPHQLEQLIFIVRLRWLSINLGFEKIIVKNNNALLYFVNNQQSPYYKSNIFEKIIEYISLNPKMFRIKEQNNKLLLKIEGISNIESVFNIISSIRDSIW